MLTERTYDSAVFKVLLNIITIFVFTEQKLIEILYEILIAYWSRRGLVGSVLAY